MAFAITYRPDCCLEDNRLSRPCYCQHKSTEIQTVLCVQAQTRTSTACEALQFVGDIVEECAHREHVVDLLRGMLHEDPVQRLTMNQILAHPFLRV